MIYLSSAAQSLFSLFQSKATKEFNAKVAEIEALAQKALGSPHATVTSTKHTLVLDIGYKGPVTSWYIDHLLRVMLKNVAASKEGCKIIISKDEIAKASSSISNYIHRAPFDVEFYLSDINNDCGDDLSENCPQIMQKYTSWKSKPEGAQPGIVATKQNEKSTIIKRCSVDEGLDFAFFSLAKDCGVVVPKVKMQTSGNHYYLFSKHLGKDTYKDLNDYLFDPSCFIDFDTLTIHLGRKEDGTFAEAISIERLSVARVMVASALFGLSDIHSKNIGLILQNIGGIKLFQLALCDCDLIPKSEDRKLEKKAYKSLGECVREHVVKFHSWENHHPLLKLLLHTISDDEFQVAFEQFKGQFPQAQKRTKPGADPIVKDLLRQQKSLPDLPHFEETWNRWNHNFGILCSI